MTRNEQKELLICTANQIHKEDLRNILKFMIENSNKENRCKLEQYLMDNNREEYTIAWKEMFIEE